MIPLAPLFAAALAFAEPPLRFPIPTPRDLPLVREGKATLEELIREGEANWYRDAQLEGEPFGVPEPLFDAVFGGFRGPGRDAVTGVLEWAVRTGLPHVAGEDLPRGLVRSRAPGRPPVVTQNCSACHSGVVNGRLIAGVGNKRYDQSAILRSAKLFMQASVLGLRAAGNRELLARTREQLAKLERYEALYGKGCTELGPGMITAARIWQISSKLLTDPAQLAAPGGLARFPCGETKPPPLNTLRYTNLHFWDGAVNTLWVAHWPMFDFFGFDDYERWLRKIETREIQSVDAFLLWGTASPSWDEIVRAPVRPALAARGHALFHRPNACASCHGTYSRGGMLERYVPAVTPLAVIGTDPERALAATDELLTQFARYGWAYVPRLEDPGGRFGPGYRASPLCSTFLNYPYLHTAGVANLHELLQHEERRSRAYWLSDSLDPDRVGYPTRVRDGSPGMRRMRVRERAVRGHSGERFGTNLPESDRAALVEYLKTLRCP